MAHIEKQDFQFRNYCNLRVFDSKEHNISSPASLVTTCRKYGLVFVAGPSFIQGILMSELKDKGTDSRPKNITDDYLNRTISVPFNPTHLDVTCNDQLLVVVGTYDHRSVLYLYKITAFLTAQDVTASTEVRITSTPCVLVTELSCNPSVPTQIAVCTSDESVFVYTFKENGAFEIFSLPPEAHSTCLSWSPKGKQIVVGSTNGNLTQYKPELKAVKCIPLTETVFGGSSSSVVAIKWLSNFQFMAVYEKHDKSSSYVVLVNSPKTGPVTYTNFDDVCLSNPVERKTQYYLHHQQTWNVVIVASSSGSEIGIIGMNADGVTWCQWYCDDSYRPQLPYDDQGLETYPLGLSVDYSSQIEIPNGDGKIRPMPIFCSLSTDGVLYSSFMINMANDAPSVVVPPALSSPIMYQYFTKTSVSQRSSRSLEQTTAINSNNQNSKPIQPPGIAANITTQATIKLPENNAPRTIASQPIVSSHLAQQLIASQLRSQQPIASQLMTQQPIAPQLMTQQPISPQLMVQQPIAPQLMTQQPMTTQSIVSQLLAQQPSPSQVAEEEELKAKQMDTVILNAIGNQVKGFEHDLKDIKALISGVRFQIGSDKEKKELINYVAKMEEFCSELDKTTISLSGDVTQLKNLLLENFVWVEEIKSRYKLILNGRCWSQVDKLDKVGEGILKDIQSNIYRIEDDIARLNDVLDDIWMEFQQSIKQIPGRMKVPVMECIYKTIKTQRDIIDRQEVTLNEMYTKLIQAGKCKKQQKLTAALASLRLSNKQNNNDAKSELSRLAENVLKMKLGNKETVTGGQSENITNKCLKLNASSYKLSKHKQLKLQELHNYHVVTRIKPIKRSNNNNNTKSSTNLLLLDSSLILPDNNNVVKKPTLVQHQHTNTMQSNNTQIQHPSTDSQLTGLLLKLISETQQGKEILHTIKQQITFTDNLEKPEMVMQTPTKTKVIKEISKTVVPPSPVGRSTPKSINPIIGQSQLASLKTVKQKLSIESDYGEYSDSDSDDKVSVISQPLCNDTPQDLSTHDKENSFTFSLNSINGKVDMFKSSSMDMTKDMQVTTTSASLFKPTVTSTGQSLMGLLNARGTTLTPSSTPKVSTAATSDTFFGVPTTTKASANSTPTPKTNTFSFSSFAIPTMATVSASPTTAAQSTASLFSTPVSTQAPLFSSLNISPSSLFNTKTTTSIFGTVVTTSSPCSPVNPVSSVTSSESNQTVESPVATSADTNLPPLFGNAAVTSLQTTKSQLFGYTASTSMASTTTSQSSIFGSPLGLNTVATQSSIPASSIPAIPSVAQSLIFGTAATTSAFGSATITVATSTATSQSSSGFGALTSTSSSIFGSPSAPVSTADNSIFGAKPTFSTTTSTVFGTPATTSIFGTSTTSSIFGAPTSTSSIFGAPTTTSSIFGAPTTTASIFGAPTTTPSIFGAPTTSTSIFGAPTTTTSSIFGTPVTTSSIFGSPSQSTTSSSIFGSPTTSTTSSIFGTPNVTTTSIFGQPATTTSAFGQPAFGGSSSIFGQPKVTDTQGSIFGSKPTFGSTAPAFQGTSAFGTGSFSSGGSSVATGGFGSPATFQKPLFGSSTAFGASPTIGRQSAFGSTGFGSPPSFGSPNKVFGQANQAAGFGAQIQQTSPFGNMANENTVSFGNLAAQQTPPFASQPPAFGANQQQNTFAGSSFGGSSFSSWR